MMKVIPLGEVAHVNMGSAPPGASYNENGEGVPMIAGAGDYGEEYPKPKKYTTAPSRLTEIGDLIVCIRATIGDLNWADKKYCLGRGVAGIRPKKERLDIKYLAHYIKTKRRNLAKLGTGSTFLAIRRADLKNFPVPLPPLSEQKRIAAILDKADAICKKRQAAIKLADEFLRAVFLDMFGDPVTNPKGWPLFPLNELGILARGKSKHRPRNDPILLGGNYPLIQTGDIATSDHFIRDYTQTYSEIGLKQSKLWPAKTLCITIAANIADTGILTFDACFPDSVVGFTPTNRIRIEYIHMWLTFYQTVLRREAPESAQKNINLRILSDLKLPAPPFDLQERFGGIFYCIEEIKNKMRSAHENTLEEFHSLTQLAFRGEL